MTITEKLNEIEEQTKEIAQQARELETSKRAYEGLLECEIHDHKWSLEGVVANLRYVQTIEIHCVRCRCYAMYGIGHLHPANVNSSGIAINTPSDIPLTTLIPEEDE